MFNPNPGGWFEIAVTDLSRARHFYHQLLGVEFHLMEMPGCSMACFPFDHDKAGSSGALVQGEGGRRTEDPPFGHGLHVHDRDEFELIIPPRLDRERGGDQHGLAGRHPSRPKPPGPANTRRPAKSSQHWIAPTPRPRTAALRPHPNTRW